ncbi:MAG: YegP family protein [Oscillospiraceae bacterium]|nr:YegP family protein [Oscillospiraceae bacterium]
MGKFVITKTKNGEYTFNLKATNGQVILAAGESFKTLDTCKNSIESVKKNALSHVEDQTVEGFETLTHPKYELYQDKAGEYRFRLKARNGENIGKSEGYKSKASALNGIESIGKNAPDGEVIVEE